MKHSEKLAAIGELADALFNDPSLTPEQEDEYIIKLEDIALPIKKRAIESFEKNARKGIEERVRNKWIDKSCAMIKKYKPKFKDQKFEEPVLGTQEAFSGLTFDLEPKPVSVPADQTGGKK